MATTNDKPSGDHAPGQHRAPREKLRNYVTGLILAVILTAASFWAADAKTVWGPSIPVLLAALAIAQMGVHLVFFLHISSAPDSTNNILALAFGVFVVALVVFGSLIIMGSLNSNMGLMDPMMQIGSPK